MNKAIAVVVGVLVVLGAGWWLLGGQATGSEEAMEVTPETTSADLESTNPAATGSTVTVTYDGTKFSPAEVTINVGDTVTFVDAGPRPMWVASAMHPAHVVYDGTSKDEHCAAGYTGPVPFDQCSASTANYIFKFTAAGTWGYHDHVNASAFGKVVVQ